MHLPGKLIPGPSHLMARFIRGQVRSLSALNHKFFCVENGHMLFFIRKSVYTLKHRQSVYTENEPQMAKALRKSLENYKAQFPELSVFVGQKSIFGHYCIQNGWNSYSSIQY